MLWSLFAVFYCTVAVFGIIMTCSESLEEKEDRSVLMTAAGILSCVVWPLVVVVMIVAARRSPAKA